MIVQKVTARKVKGQTFAHTLSPAVAVIGPNFAGKSAILEAIRRGLTGKMQSGDVIVALDNGSSVTRSGRKTVTDGAFPVLEMPLVPLLDDTHYFGLPDSQRTNYVFERVKLPDQYYSVDLIISGIERISLEEEHSELVEKAKGDLIKSLRPLIAKGTIQEGIAAAVELCREQFTYWNRRAKETQGAVTTLTELKLQEKQVAAAPVKLDEEMKAASDELERINTEKGRATAERDAGERNAGRRKQHQKALDADRIDYPRMLDQHQEEKVALEKQLVPDPDPEEIEATRRTIAAATQAINNADTAVGLHDKAIGDINSQLEAMTELTECPYCQAKGKGWKKSLEANLTEKRAEIEERIRVATESRDRANDTLRDANETLETLLRAQTDNASLGGKITAIEARITALTNEQKAEAEKRDRWTREIKEMPAPVDVKNLNRQIADLEEKRRALATKISELNGKKLAETRLQQDLLRAAQAEREHQTAKANVVIIKAAAAFLKEKKEAATCEAFTKLLQVANMMVKSILLSPLVLHENTIGRFDGGDFVPHQEFSGTEKALTYIAIATALSADAPVKLVLLDEFGRLDPTLQLQVASRLMNLVNEGVIDQVIIASPTIPEAVRTSTAWQVIEVER